jgi:hypothetical protein
VLARGARKADGAESSGRCSFVCCRWSELWTHSVNGLRWSQISYDVDLTTHSAGGVVVVGHPGVDAAQEPLAGRFGQNSLHETKSFVF